MLGQGTWTHEGEGMEMMKERRSLDKNSAKV
jgi:hypothetical protein